MSNLIERNRWAGWGRRLFAALALGLAVGALSACDGLLDVDLPAELTDAALNDPAGASTLMTTLVTHFENGFDGHLDQAAGREGFGEVFMCGPCNPYNFPVAHTSFADFAKSRRFARLLHDKLTDDWTVTQVPQRAQYLAIASIYEGAALSWMGQNLCEAALDGGKKLTADETLTMADGVLTRALTEIQAAGDFPMPSRIGSSAMRMTYGLRAQVRWMLGNNAGAAADAAQVPQGFRAFVTRDAARLNYFAFTRDVGSFLDLYDPIDWWAGGTNPATGQPWPKVLPFTGYNTLGIMPDGRAVHEDGIPIRYANSDVLLGNNIGVEAGAVADPRVSFRRVQIQGKGGFGYAPTKYPASSSDIPLVNWQEMVLIRAEAAGGQQAITLVNQLRAAANLPLVTYADPNNAKQIRYMIIEERRRALYAEARYLQTMLKNPDVAWFPRGVGGTRGFGHKYTGGVRFTMPDNEFINNENLSTADKGTGCKPLEAPVNVNI
jgi:hypothetical protein